MTFLSIDQALVLVLFLLILLPLVTVNDNHYYRNKCKDSQNGQNDNRGIVGIVPCLIYAVVEFYSALMAALILVGIVGVHARDLSTHIICLLFRHEVVRFVIVVCFTDDVLWVDWTDTDCKVSLFLFDVRSHVQEVIVLRQKVGADGPSVTLVAKDAKVAGVRFSKECSFNL